MNRTDANIAPVASPPPDDSTLDDSTPGISTPDTSTPDAALIGGALAAAGHPEVVVHAFATLPSTNTWLAARPWRPDAVPELCIAGLQSDGLGRRGRGWVGVPGNITFSLRRLFEGPVARLSMLSLVTGIAVAETLRNETGLEVLIKWPNDLILGQSKLGGLLAEARSGDSGMREGNARLGVRGGIDVTGGIGVNLRADPAFATLGIGGTSLEAHGIDPARRDPLVAALAARVLDGWKSFDREGWAPFAACWRALDWLHGREVRVIDARREFDGRALGLDVDGGLRIACDEGLVTVHAADVSVRPRP